MKCKNEVGDHDDKTSQTKRDEIRIVLVGKTGSGKSATGNSILGRDSFGTLHYARSATRIWQVEEVIRMNKKLLIVDTPGFFDTEKPAAETEMEITRCMQLTSPGPHCFLFIIQVGRFSTEEHNTLKLLKQLFGDEVMPYLITVFTKVDTLKGDTYTTLEQRLENYVQTVPKELQSLLDNCNNTYIGLDNSQPSRRRKKQTEPLLNLIESTIKIKDCKYYDCSAFEQVHKRKIANQENERLKRADNDRKRKEMISHRITNEVDKKYKEAFPQDIKDLKDQFKF